MKESGRADKVDIPRKVSLDISIIGSGYVGLVVAAGLASIGYRIVCIEQEASKVDLVNQGQSPVCDDGLGDLLSTCVGEGGNLSACRDFQRVLDTDITFICVGTPPGADGSMDSAQIEAVTAELGRVLAAKQGFHVVVIKSSVAPGTTRNVIIPLLERFSGKSVGRDIGVAVNPEFLQEGRALRCFLNPDRTVIGASDPHTGDVVEEIFGHFSAPVLRTDVTTAEMIKYASNAFLATKISFVNEIAGICHQLGIDVAEVARGMGFDPRIGSTFLQAGIGFGGSCLPKDLQALIAVGRGLGYTPELLESVLAVNTAQAMKMVETAQQALGGVAKRTIAVLGLAFKPGTDDVRDAPALKVIEALLRAGATIKAYDPMAMPNARRVLPDGVRYCHSAAEAVAGSDCVLVVTEWDEFRDEGLYRGRLVVDGRRVLEPGRARQVCDYHGICW